ncbi:discoidin domain-containing protein [Paenibacillus sp. GCM10027630]
MNMSTVLKKSMIPVLLMIVMLLTLLTNSNRAHADNEPNLALNPNGTGYPELTASNTCGCDSVWSVVNGIFSYNESPRDRWTNYGSPNPTDWVAINFGSAKSFNQVKLYVFNDGGGVQTPASYLIQYWNGSDWISPTNQIKTPELPEASLSSKATPATTLNTVDFDTVTSDKLRVVFTSRSFSYSGLVELEVFLHQTEDQIAAAAVMTLIGQLPVQASVALTDKPAISAARTAYNNLTLAQRSLVTNLSKLTAAEAAIAALEVDQIAAAAVMTLIGQLPVQASVALTDKPAITVARIAYNVLTVSQKSLVTNLSKLTAAEAAIVTLETPKMKDINILSAFGDESGHRITIKLSSVLDVTYGVQPAKFQILASGVQSTATNAVYDLTDSSHQTIKLSFASPVLLNETSVSISIQSGAFKTSSNELNNAIQSRPVITFKKLDLSNDNRIGVDDIVLMMSNAASQIDVNQDGVFNREDIFILLSQISMRLR